MIFQKQKMPKNIEKAVSVFLRVHICSNEKCNNINAPRKGFGGTCVPFVKAPTYIRYYLRVNTRKYIHVYIYMSRYTFNRPTHGLYACLRL